MRHDLRASIERCLDEAAATISGDKFLFDFLTMDEGLRECLQVSRRRAVGGWMVRRWPSHLPYKEGGHATCHIRTVPATCHILDYMRMHYMLTTCSLHAHTLIATCSYRLLEADQTCAPSTGPQTADCQCHRRLSAARCGAAFLIYTHRHFPRMAEPCLPRMPFIAGRLHLPYMGGRFHLP